MEVVELNAQPEHVHMLAIIPPKYAIAKVVEIIKSRSAKVMRSEYAWFDKPYYDTPSFRSEHVHMLAIIPPKYAIAKVVEIIKSRSAKVMRSEYAWFDKPYYDTPSF